MADWFNTSAVGLREHLGERARVWSFTKGDGWLTGEKARRYEGEVVAVTVTPGDYLSTKIKFRDGRTVYARDYAVAAYEKPGEADG